MKNKKHIISGGNFHGEYRIVVIGPAEGFIISESQGRRISKALCGMSDCKCGGGYGRGYDSNSAKIIYDDYDSKTGKQIGRIIPAGE